MNLRLLSRIALAAACSVLVAGCGSSKSSSSASTSTTEATTTTVATSTTAAGGGAAANTISIKGFQFTVGAVKAGATVTVTNGDSAPHTVTSDTSGTFNVQASPQGSTTFTAPSKAGTYPFHCSIHASMHGTLTVS